VLQYGIIKNEEATMKVIEATATFTQPCSCGVTLQVEANDVGEDMHSGGYGFNCPRCGRYHRVAFKDLPKAIQDAIARWESGH
jgi:hypothetical protein